MNQVFRGLYKDLLLTKKDLENHLKFKDLSEQVRKLAEEDLQDINSTIEKWEAGFFGVCEKTGHPLPSDLLLFQPTIKTLSELQEVIKYFKKPFFGFD